MNRYECKKYLRRAYKRLVIQSKPMNPENIAVEMQKEIEKESKKYIAYAKLAIHNLNKSATKIDTKQLTSQIDVIDKIYNFTDMLSKIEKM